MCQTTYQTERFTKAGKAMHTCNGDVISGLPFGKKAAPGECRRCDELRGGAAVRVPAFVARKADEEREVAAIRQAYTAATPADLEIGGKLYTAFQW